MEHIKYESTFYQVIKKWSLLFPEKIFLRQVLENEEKTITYGDAIQNIESLSESIKALADENIGLILNNSIKTIVLFYAIVTSGKNVVLIDHQLGKATLETILSTANINTIIGDTKPNNSILSNRYKDIQSSKSYSFSCNDNAKVIVFTSGTTSTPKGVVLSQKALIYAYQLGINCLEINESYSSGCFYRISGLGILGINFLFMHVAGGTGNMLPEYAYTHEDKLKSYIEKFEINFLYIVPAIVNYVINYYSSTASSWFCKILSVSSAAPLSKKQQDLFQVRFGPLANIYGLTECGFAFLFGERIGEYFTSSVGAAKGLQIKIIDDYGIEINNQFSNGRLYVKTPSFFDGYYLNDQLTSQIFKDGWLDSKDMAYYDENKNIYLVGRIDDTINKGGNLFHLSEADEFFLSIHTVIDSYSIKVKCDYYDEDYITCLFVEPNCYNYNFETLVEENLGIHRAPKKIIILDNEIPRNSAGKYDRKKLLDIIDSTMKVKK